MSSWNFDMDAAPRGHTKETVVGKATRDIHVREMIVVAADDGKTVTSSRWLPDEGRWEMFTKDHPPIAWQPWSKTPGEHPLAQQDQA